MLYEVLTSPARQLNADLIIDLAGHLRAPHPSCRGGWQAGTADGHLARPRSVGFVRKYNRGEIMHIFRSDIGERDETQTPVLVSLVKRKCPRQKGQFIFLQIHQFEHTAAKALNTDELIASRHRFA